MTDDVIISLLSQRNWFMYNKDLAFLIGAKEAILVGHLVNKYTIHKESGNLIEGGWFYESREFIMIDTGLDDQFQTRATRKLVQLGIIEVKRMGIPAKNYYRINPQGLQDALVEGQNKRENKIIEYREEMKKKRLQKSQKSKPDLELENGFSPQRPQNEVSEENPVKTTETSKGRNLIPQNEGTSAVKNDEQDVSKMPTNNNKQNNNLKKEITFAEILNQILSIRNELTSLRDYPTDKLKSTIREYGRFDLEEFRRKVSNFALIKSIVQEQPWLAKYIFIDLGRMTLSAFVTSYYNIFDEKLETALTKISNVKEQKSIPKLFGAFGIIDEKKRKRIEEEKLLSEQEKLKKDYELYKKSIAEDFIQSKKSSGEYEGTFKEYATRLVDVNKNAFVLSRYLESGASDKNVINHFKAYVRDKYCPQISFETRKQENAGSSRVEEQ